MHPAPADANPVLYTILVYAHIMLGLSAIGFNFTYAVWIRRGTSNPATLLFALKGVKFIDDYLANPCYIAAGATGLLMILMGKSIASFLWVAIALYLIVMAVAYLIYTPLLSRQIKVLDAKGQSDPEYAQIGQRSNIVGAAMGITAVVIVALKIFEPTFWT